MMIVTDRIACSHP